MCRVGRFIVAYMDEMIRKLYAQMQMEKEYDDPIEQRVREELLRLLELQKEPWKAEAGRRSVVEKGFVKEKQQEKLMPEAKEQSDQSEPASANGTMSSEAEEAARTNEAIGGEGKIEKNAWMNEAIRNETEKSAVARLDNFSKIDQLYAAAEVGEEAGFVRGFRYGFRLCMECMQD